MPGVDTAVAREPSSAVSVGLKKSCRCSGADSNAAPSTFAPNKAGDGGTAPVSIAKWSGRPGTLARLVGVAAAGPALIAGKPMALAVRATAEVPVLARTAQLANLARPDVRPNVKSLRRLCL